MKSKLIVIVLVTMSILLVGTTLCFKEQIFIEYYKSKGVYYSKSIDIIPGYKHLPERYLRNINEKNLKDICDLVSISNESFYIKNKKVSKVLIKIIDNNDTEVGLYQSNGNYFDIISRYNYLGSIFKNIIRNKSKTFLGIELFDTNFKLNAKYRILKTKGDDNLFINE